MAGEYINSKAGKKRIKKQWKYREKKDELHTFKDTTAVFFQEESCLIKRQKTYEGIFICLKQKEVVPNRHDLFVF